MSRPSDVTQEAWNAAHKPTIMLMGGVSAPTEAILDQVQGFYQAIVARAIMAAEQRERKACESRFMVYADLSAEGNRAMDIVHITGAVKAIRGSTNA